MNYKLITLFASFVIMSMINLHAQVTDSLKGNGAFIFAYYPKNSMQQEFENGYKQHLDWHQQNNDPLAWYAWYVQTGSRLGLFIDGTFGLSFQAFDNRVNPAGDRADFTKTTAPFADLAFRQAYKLRTELSTGFLLENFNPTSSIEVFEIIVTSGGENKFEKIFSELKGALINETDKPIFTVYQLLTGGEHSGYLLMIPRNNFSYFDDEGSIISINSLVEAYLPNKASEYLEDLSKTIKRQTSETWGYRKDLSSFPESKKP